MRQTDTSYSRITRLTRRYLHRSYVFFYANRLRTFPRVFAIAVAIHRIHIRHRTIQYSVRNIRNIRYPRCTDVWRYILDSARYSTRYVISLSRYPRYTDVSRCTLETPRRSTRYAISEISETNATCKAINVQDKPQLSVSR